MMRVGIALHICLLLLSVATRHAAPAPASIFQECDVDEDRALTEAELSACLGDPSSRNRHSTRQSARGERPLTLSPLGMNANLLVALLDTNKDGVVQLDEYALAVKRMQGDKLFREEHGEPFGGLEHGVDSIGNSNDASDSPTPTPDEEAAQGEGEAEGEGEGEGVAADAMQSRFDINGRGDLTPQQRAARAKVALPAKTRVSRQNVHADVNTHAPQTHAHAHAQPYDMRLDEDLHERLRKRTMTPEAEDEDEDDWGEDSVELEADRAELASQRASSDIKLTLRNGTVLYVTREEMYRILQMNEIEQEPLRAGMSSSGAASAAGGGGVLGDEDALDADGYDAADLSDLHQQKPEMSHFIGLARWAVARLQAADSYARPIKSTESRPPPPQGGEPEPQPSIQSKQLRRFPKAGRIEQLRSLPVGGSPKRGSENASEPLFDAPDGKFDLFLELSIRVTVDKSHHSHVRARTRLEKYEVHVSKNMDLYRYPHVAVVGLWQLSDRGYRKTGAQDSMELPLVRRTRRPGPNTNRGRGAGAGAANGEEETGGDGGSAEVGADAVSRVKGYALYAVDVITDLAAMTLDQVLQACPSVSSAPAEQEQGQGQSREVTFLILSGFIASLLGILYLVVLPVVWVALRVVFGASAAAEPDRAGEEPHQHVD